MEEYQTLQNLVTEAAEEVAKAEAGNKAAGVRTRKLMQDVKKAANEVRVKILALRQQ